MPLPEYLLIIAGSCRMLAQLANKSGMQALVIDLFADVDTQFSAGDVFQVPSLAKEHLTPAVDYFIQRYGVAHAIYGSGFEAHPESLVYLSSRLVLLGNSPDVFLTLLNKPKFFSILDNLKIPYPETVFNPPNIMTGWLVKPMNGQGGVGIQHYQAASETPAQVYFQKFQVGTAHSVLFLADGQKIRIIGFNSQWTVALDDKQPYIFSGISNYCSLLPEQKTLILHWLSELVPVLSLKGLNTLDFIQTIQQSYLLEINPRLSASVQLYEGDWLSLHIQATQGALPEADFVQRGFTAYQIVYAEQDIVIPEFFCWPEACCDLPPARAIIRKNQPICSIIAHQNTAGLLRQTLQTIQNLLFKGLYPHGIHC